MWAGICDSPLVEEWKWCCVTSKERGASTWPFPLGLVWEKLATLLVGESVSPVERSPCVKEPTCWLSGRANSEADPLASVKHSDDFSFLA